MLKPDQKVHMTILFQNKTERRFLSSLNPYRFVQYNQKKNYIFRKQRFEIHEIFVNSFNKLRTIQNYLNKNIIIYL